jgi:two-component sensor histidine kinase
MNITREMLAGSWRRWWSYDVPRVGPRWLDSVWTGLFSLSLALVFTLLWFISRAQGAAAWQDPALWLRIYGSNLWVTLVICFLIQGLFLLAEKALGEAWIRSLKGWRRTGFYAGLQLLGLLIGWPLGYRTLAGQLPAVRDMSVNAIVGSLLLALLISLIFHVVWIARSREIAARMQATEAQLRLLQAQIEPHFLFNTLANVLSLVEAEPARAKAMLETFIDYLRSSLQQQRRSEATLDEELALAEAYLQLMGARMGERLRHEVQATPEARQCRLPPLLLQPLVENAIRHGLEPQVDGGTVRIEATLQDGCLRLRVIDDGRGLDAPRRPGPQGAGVALLNIRERLAARHGSAARLTLGPRPEGGRGTCAELLLPA